MSDFSDDDTGLWQDQYSEPTIQIAPVRRRTPERTRSHHVIERDSGHRGYDHGYDADHDDEQSAYDTIWLEPVRRTRRGAGTAARRGGGLFGSIDPRLLSVGAAALAAVVAVPLFSALSGGGEENDSFLSVAEAETTTTTVVSATVAPSSSVVVITAALNPVPAESGNGSSYDVSDAGASASAGNSDSAADDESGSGGGSSGGSGGSQSGAAGASGVLPAPIQRSAAQCGNPYEIQAGDFWIALADAVGMSLDDFLSYNEATAETPLYVGSIVCLPLGTSVTSSTVVPVTAAPTTAPAPTVTTEPETIPATTPTTTATPQTDPPTTLAAPATTQAPATTKPPDDDDDGGGGGIPLPTNPVPSGGAVEQMIRDIWPDDLEEQALRIAWRESGFRPDVTSPTGCCHGVFQLHWFAHDSWLSDLGITSRDQLFDARTNIQAAYALYLRSGWGPWQ